jgi:hypothetical protein
LALPVHALGGGSAALRPGTLEIGTDWQNTGATNDTAKTNPVKSSLFIRVKQLTEILTEEA